MPSFGQLSGEQMDSIDDQPEACTGMIIHSDGESIYDYEKRTKGSISQFAEQMKKTQDRIDLAKSIDSIRGTKLSGDEPTRRRVTKNESKIFTFPAGKLIESFPKNFAVLIEGKKDSWFFVRGYWSRQCSYGWVNETDLISIPRKDLEKQKIFGH